MRQGINQEYVEKSIRNKHKNYAYVKHRIKYMVMYYKKSRNNQCEYVKKSPACTYFKNNSSIVWRVYNGNSKHI